MCSVNLGISSHSTRYCFVILCLGLLITVLWLFFLDENLFRPYQLQQRNRFNYLQTNQTFIHTAENMNFTMEWDQIQRVIHWGGPDHLITDVTMSTSPDHSTFIIDDFKNSYYVGEKLNATIIARDFNGKAKTYGGDFFQAKAYSDKLKASVFGEVKDHQNGTYTVRFILPWAGEASVAVRLIHSSEGVQILKRHRATDPDRIDFNGFFVGKNHKGAVVKENVKCNVKWEGVALTGQGNCCCEYPDVRAGLTWYCRKPPTLPCDTLIYYSLDGYKNHMTDLEKTIMDKEYVNRWIKGDSRVIRVLGSNYILGVKESCEPGMPTPIPAGFYMKDIWTSFVCATRHFNAGDKTKCLKNKHIYIMGDSTSKQWFDFIIEAVPTLQRINLHTDDYNGPHMAVDVVNNINLHYRSHGIPRCSIRQQSVALLNYISNQIDDLAGGPHTVIIFNIGAHFTAFPIYYFANRVFQIRRAVIDLLRRAPETKIIVKTANTGHKDFSRTDWLTMQLDQILRETFRNVGIYLLDVWQMTSCHRNVEDIHPGPVIINNQVDILLSFICPN